MSVLTSYVGTFNSKVITSTTTEAGADVVYTVPPNFSAELTFLICANGGASSSKVSVLVYHADDATYNYLIREHSVGGHDTYAVIESSRIFLHPGDKIVAYKDSGSFDVSLSGKQYYNTVRNL